MVLKEDAANKLIRVKRTMPDRLKIVSFSSEDGVSADKGICEDDLLVKVRNEEVGHMPIIRGNTFVSALRA